MIVVQESKLNERERTLISNLLKIGKATLFAEVTNTHLASSQQMLPPRTGVQHDERPHGIQDDERSKGQRFTDACTAVANAMEALNGQTLTVNLKGVPKDYTFHFDAVQFVDNLLNFSIESSDFVEDQLSDSQKPDGVSLVAMFMGVVIDEHLYNSATSLHKVSLLPVFQKLYPGSTSARTRLSRRPMDYSHPANQLASKFIDFVLQKKRKH